VVYRGPTQGENFLIGAMSYMNLFTVNGIVDEVRVYNRVIY
jgi:hypothetical protein